MYNLFKKEKRNCFNCLKCNDLGSYLLVSYSQCYKCNNELYKSCSICSGTHIKTNIFIIRCAHKYKSSL